MPSGLVALLDDVAIIARAAAASMDDIGIAASRAGSKAAGIVIDDAAVTPSYVVGVYPTRELPIIWKIAKGSLINKLLILLPLALILSQFLPWIIMPLLMLGGAFLCYEGAEKVLEKLGAKKHGKTIDDSIDDPVEFEKQRVTGAIRTDLILSAEIMAITLNEVTTETLSTQAIVLALVGAAITFVVYGAVALIVKLDDIGFFLIKKSSELARRSGRAIVFFVPKLLIALSVIGTAAMLWVGGGILIHGTHELGWHLPHDTLYVIKSMITVPFFAWLGQALAAAILGLAAGSVIALVLHTFLGKGAETS